MQHLALSSTFPLGSNEVPSRRHGVYSMKVVAFNGSARKDGNTAILVRQVYWNIGIGRAKGEVEQDEEGLRTMETLGQNMAWLLKKINT